jgi:UDP:flavonoid glycosyltransferase YjiC (YdhE family)
MRVLFATTAGAGHFGPLVAFARAAARAGHEVAVAAPGPFESAVREAGFDVRLVGGPSDEDRAAMFARIGQASFDDANMIMLRDGFLGIYPRAALPAMLEHVDRWRPDVIVRETAEVASLVAAERHAIPHVEVAIGLRAFSRTLSGVASEPLAALFEGADVPTDRVEPAMDEPALTFTPPSLEVPEDRGRAEAFSSEVPPRLPIDGARPLVFVTLGSEAAAQGFFPDFYRAIIGKLADPGVELVVALGRSADPAAIEPLPPGVRVETWVDQSDVLRRASATVFHGGYGTMIGSLAAGTPMLCIPLFSIDQRMNAHRIAAVGAGLAIDGPEDLGSLPGAVQRVLGEASFRGRARAFAAEIAALPSPDEAVRRLESLAD